MDRANRSRPVSSLLVLCLLISTASAQLNTNEVQATQFLNDLDPIYLREANAQMKARWDYITDVTDAHSQAQVKRFLDHSLTLKLKHRVPRLLVANSNLSISSVVISEEKLTVSLTGCALSRNQLRCPCPPTILHDYSKLSCLK